MPNHDAPDFGARHPSLDRIAAALGIMPGTFFDTEATADLDQSLLLELWSAVTRAQARQRILSLASAEAGRGGRGKGE